MAHRRRRARRGVRRSWVARRDHSVRGASDPRRRGAAAAAPAPVLAAAPRRRRASRAVRIPDLLCAPSGRQLKPAEHQIVRELALARSLLGCLACEVADAYSEIDICWLMPE